MTGADVTRSLSTEQQVAAGTPHRRLYIEAAPGSGKTTVAAQRFGVHRFLGKDPRAVIAVSFTRSATSELRERVLSRWGPSALSFPHRVVTLDTIVCDLLTHLLHTGHVRWPAGHRHLTVIDHWGVLLPTRWTDWNPIVVLDAGEVVTKAVKQTKKASRPKNADVRNALADGYCTHEAIRHLLESALATPSVRGIVLDRLAETSRALIVDEVFDANALDLFLVRLVADAGLEVTLVGDPWQALYGFRGARPEQVPVLVKEADFIQRNLNTSFRWKSEQQTQLADRLRAGQGVTLPREQSDDLNVLLALQWKPLWEAGPHILPLAFGSAAANIHEAACTLLLSEITQRMFGENAAFHNDALTTLRIDHEAAQRLRSPLQSIVNDLAGSTDIAEVWSSLNTVIASETDRPLPRRRAPVHTDRLEKMRARLQTSAVQIVPGLTAHQAKGREWDTVGVFLTDPERETLRHGLTPDNEEHRKLYVALTRAKRKTFVS
ncbi:UvrD-helicase domain-containing protein [Streptomyces sp. NPDC007872]|uniref:UvrD-helicase domain-containing protein n=1 Tax=Streptomyces sp. NPDC007872 TaxID=3364782 RepID=UPI0036C0624F